MGSHSESFVEPEGPAMDVGPRNSHNRPVGISSHITRIFVETDRRSSTVEVPFKYEEIKSMVEIHRVESAGKKPGDRKNLEERKSFRRTYFRVYAIRDRFPINPRSGLCATKFRRVGCENLSAPHLIVGF